MAPSLLHSLASITAHFSPPPVESATSATATAKEDDEAEPAYTSSRRTPTRRGRYILLRLLKFKCSQNSLVLRTARMSSTPAITRISYDDDDADDEEEKKKPKKAKKAASKRKTEKKEKKENKKEKKE